MWNLCKSMYITRLNVSYLSTTGAFYISGTFMSTELFSSPMKCKLVLGGSGANFGRFSCTAKVTILDITGPNKNDSITL